jgi:hypothetical protein
VETKQEQARKGENFLNNEEVDNLQDMMNYAAASINQKELFPIESLYSQNLGQQNTTIYYTNEKIDKEIKDILKS